MPAGNSWLDPLRKPVDRLRAGFERFLSGPPPDDPLYLSNRSWKKKVQVGLVIAAPVLVLGGLVAIGATDLLRFHKVDPYEHPPAEAPAPVAQKRLPEPVMSTTDLEVVNIRITKDSHNSVVTGVVRNNTNQKVDSAEVSYYLADNEGSLVGTDTTDVSNVQPHGSVTFRMPLKIANAHYVIVRDVHLN